MPLSLPLPKISADGDADRVSRHLLVRYVHGDLDADGRAALDAQFATSDALRARLDAVKAELAAEDAAFAIQVPFAAFAERHAARQSGPLMRVLSLLRSFSLPAGGALAATAALVFVVRAVGAGGATAPETNPALAHLLDKGGARIGFFVSHEEGVRPGRDGDTLHAGDRIQFAVRDALDRRSMVVVGIDGAGAVSVYAVEDLSAQRAKGATSTRLLGSSVILDDSRGAERFFVVFGDESPEALKNKVERAAKALAAAHANLDATETLPLSEGELQSSVRIRKVAAP